MRRLTSGTYLRKPPLRNQGVRLETVATKDDARRIAQVTVVEIRSE